MASEPIGSSASSLLALPTEIRIRIYSSLFSGTVLSPAWRDLGPGSLKALEQEANSPRQSVINLLGFKSDSDLSGEWEAIGNWVPQRPRYPADLSILRVCRKTYHEAYPLLFRLATFSLATMEDHLRLTQPTLLPRFGQIRNLSVCSSVLTEWSATLVRLVLPSVSRFEIRDLHVYLSHDEMRFVDALLPNADVLQDADPFADLTVGDIAQSLLLSTTESNLLPSIISHFTAAPDRYECLVLHFNLRCNRLGMMHEHLAHHLVFAFGNAQFLTRGLRLSTLPVSQWDETALICRSGFTLAERR